MLALADLHPRDHLDAGGKARHLARLTQAGLPVPRGAVVLAAWFRHTLRRSGLLEHAERVHRGALHEAPALRQGILDIKLPPDLQGAWIRHAEQLGERLAVRSSGLDEDGRSRSFAGQHESILGLPPPEVPQAILRCWASLYAPRAMSYRGTRGPAPGSLAVLVQTLIEPSSAGVLFTINPLNGSWREMVVEAVWGQGEGLVSGQLTPHWYLVRRPRALPRPLQRLVARVRLEVMERDLPELQERLVSGPGGALVREPVPKALAHRATLEPAELKRLCRLGLRVEGTLGGPQDIEWARDPSGRLVLLQARPITATGRPRARQDILWTRRFIGERWPQPATPMGWSLLEPLISWFIAYPQVQRAHLGGGPALKLHRSRPYINATVFRHLAFKLPGTPPPQFMLELIPSAEAAQWRRRFAVAPHAAVYASILRTTVRERRWARFAWNPLTNLSAWGSFQERLDGQLPRLAAPLRTPQEGITRVEQQIELIREYIGIHICSLLFANLSYQLLDSALASTLPRHRAELMAGLATSPPGNLTVATNEALHELAQVASPADLKALAEGAPSSWPFQQALDTFLQAYGHRAEASWELMAPRWREHPELLAPLLEVQRQAAHTPGHLASAQQHAFEEAQSLLRQSLSGAQLAWLELLVTGTRRYLLLRENQRFWFDKLLWTTQTTLRKLGETLVEGGRLKTAQEVAFLTWPELRGALTGELELHPDWITKRRDTLLADSQRQPPTFLMGAEAPREPTGHRLQGLGISPGRARGVVRVLHNASQGARLQRGDILVARTVDPGWTPLFLTAGAVVLEMGSVLSHGAVVAREYKVPAVVNIDGVTRRLQDGQEVTVDGSRGVVYVH